MNAKKSESRGVAKSLRSSLAALALICIAGVAQAGDWQQPPVNAFGAPVRDAQGRPITYTQEELAAIGIGRAAVKSVGLAASVVPQGAVPAGGANSLPFWQYAIFGSALGASGIVIGPAPPGGGAREIIIGCNSANNFGADNFWQVLSHNSTTGNYDQVFVGPVYSEDIMGIAAGNVIGDSQQELVVMLVDGRIYFYDLSTKIALGSVNTGVGGLNGLSLNDLDGIGYVELIVTTENDLFVFNNAGAVLWQVPGAGGYDVVVGQMDNDPALEIAATKGRVVDTATHTVQWARAGGFGIRLKLAPLPGTGYQQLIVAENWYIVRAYDVVTQMQRWTIDTPQDVAAIAIADVDNDGTPEVIIGDGQFGKIRVHDLISQAQKWILSNPEHDVTNIAVADVDNDGVVDLLWGAGWGSSGPDYFYVASTTGNHAIKWQNAALFGFVGPVIGDLDGDGEPEMVVCVGGPSYTVRIFVFDLATLTVRAISGPIVTNSQGGNLRDLKLRDLEGDGRMEIVVASDRLYDGLIEIYDFDTANVFTLKWTNTTRPPGPFTLVEVADLDGNGTSEIIAGHYAQTTGADGVYIYIYDYPSATNPWRSARLASTFNLVTGLVVHDLDGDGTKEFAALVNENLYTFDGPTRTLKGSSLPLSGSRILSRRLPSGLIWGDDTGVGHFLQYSNNTYTESFSRQLGSEAPDGIHVFSAGELWTGSGGVLSLRLPPSYDVVEWQSPIYGPGFGRFVATDSGNSQACVFSSAQHAIAGFNYESSGLIPGSLGNISTRLRVETGDNVLIGGFIVTGTDPKRIIVRAIGPSLPLAGALADPVLELRNSSGGLIRSNDNWRDDPAQEFEIIATGIPPSNNLEAAIAETLPANGSAYTAIVRGVNNGTGIGMVEAYDLDQTVNSKLANISTRGFVQTGDDVLIGGLIVLGQNSLRVIVRAIGPSLPFSGTLADPTLNLHDGNGTLVASNNNWREDPVQESAIIATGIPPSDDLESAMVHNLTPGSYTAIVRGVNNTTGIAVVEAYGLN